MQTVNPQPLSLVISTHSAGCAASRPLGNAQPQCTARNSPSSADLPTASLLSPIFPMQKNPPPGHHHKIHHWSLLPTPPCLSPKDALFLQPSPWHTDAPTLAYSPVRKGRSTFSELTAGYSHVVTLLSQANPLCGLDSNPVPQRQRPGECTLT